MRTSNALVFHCDFDWGHAGSPKTLIFKVDTPSNEHLRLRSPYQLNDIVRAMRPVVAFACVGAGSRYLAVLGRVNARVNSKL